MPFPTPDETMSDQIKLERPGAGLPWLERQVSSAVLQALRAGFSPATLNRWIAAETDKILALAARLDADQGRRQVLTPRLTGLEDSSRHWSVYMVLQHLDIVDSGILQLSRTLARDQDFDREVRIAEVKPDPGAGPEQAERFRAAARAYLDWSAQARPASGRRHAHPWFGPLDLRGWHALMAIHTLAHRRQVEAIIARLPRG